MPVLLPIFADPIRYERLHFTASCWRITSKYALTPTLRVTNWPENLQVTEKDTAYQDVETYTPTGGVDASALRKDSDLEASNEEWDGIISDDAFDQDRLYGGEYDGATVDLFIVDARIPWLGYLDHIRFTLRRFELNGSIWKATVDSASSFLSQAVGDTWGPRCRVAVFGTECGVDPAGFEVASEDITAVTDRGAFTVDMPSGNFRTITDYGQDGTVFALSGANAGQQRKILSSTPNSANVDIVLYKPFSSLMEIGDNVKLWPGCNRQSGFNDSSGHCVNRYANGDNFRGEHAIPGADAASEGIPL